MDSPKLSKMKIYNGINILMPKDFKTHDLKDFAGNSIYRPLACNYFLLAAYTSPDKKADFTMKTYHKKIATSGLEAWPDYTDSIDTPGKILYQKFKPRIIEIFDTLFRPTKRNKKEQVKSSLEFIKDGIRTINDNEYAYFEFTNEQKDIRNYHYIMFSERDDFVLIFEFTCDQDVMTYYQPLVNAMMSSVKVSPKVALYATEPQKF
jgi:hypothetical protein